MSSFYFQPTLRIQISTQVIWDLDVSALLTFITSGKVEVSGQVICDSDWPSLTTLTPAVRQLYEKKQSLQQHFSNQGNRGCPVTYNMVIVNPLKIYMNRI